MRRMDLWGFAQPVHCRGHIPQCVHVQPRVDLVQNGEVRIQHLRERAHFESRKLPDCNRRSFLGCSDHPRIAGDRSTPGRCRQLSAPRVSLGTPSTPGAAQAAQCSRSIARYPKHPNGAAGSSCYRGYQGAAVRTRTQQVDPSAIQIANGIICDLESCSGKGPSRPREGAHRKLQDLVALLLASAEALVHVALAGT